MIAASRLRSWQPTRAYAQRRIAEGKTKPEIIRCLKRYIAGESYHALRPDLAELIKAPARPATAVTISCARRPHRPHPTSIRTSGGNSNPARGHPYAIATARTSAPVFKGTAWRGRRIIGGPG
jgi:hypothetical protein